MLPVSVPLDEIPCPGTGAGTDHGPFATANQCAAHRSGQTADKGSLRSAMVMPSMAATLSKADAPANSEEHDYTQQ